MLILFSLRLPDVPTLLLTAGRMIMKFSDRGMKSNQAMLNPINFLVKRVAKTGATHATSCNSFAVSVA